MKEQPQSIFFIFIFARKLMIVGMDSHNAILKHARFLHFLLQTDMGSTVWESSVQCRLYETLVQSSVNSSAQ